jgi:hypothetical protein
MFLGSWYVQDKPENPGVSFIVWMWRWCKKCGDSPDAATETEHHAIA